MSLLRRAGAERMRAMGLVGGAPRGWPGRCGRWPVLLGLPSAELSTAIESGWGIVAVGIGAVQLGTASAGAVIASRMPKNAVGWMFLATGAGRGRVSACWAWSFLGLETSHGQLPGDIRGMAP
jgi:hypothetical protein